VHLDAWKCMQCDRIASGWDFSYSCASRKIPDKYGAEHCCGICQNCVDHLESFVKRRFIFTKIIDVTRFKAVAEMIEIDARKTKYEERIRARSIAWFCLPLLFIAIDLGGNEGKQTAKHYKTAARLIGRLFAIVVDAFRCRQDYLSKHLAEFGHDFLMPGLVLLRDFLWAVADYLWGDSFRTVNRWFEG